LRVKIWNWNTTVDNLCRLGFDTKSESKRARERERSRARERDREKDRTYHTKVIKINREPVIEGTRYLIISRDL